MFYRAMKISDYEKVYNLKERTCVSSSTRSARSMWSTGPHSPLRPSLVFGKLEGAGSYIIKHIKKWVCTNVYTHFLIGVTGFEPATSASRTQRSTKLSHTPLLLNCCMLSDSNLRLAFGSVGSHHVVHWTTLTSASLMSCHVFDSVGSHHVVPWTTLTSTKLSHTPLSRQHTNFTTRVASCQGNLIVIYLKSA